MLHVTTEGNIITESGVVEQSTLTDAMRINKKKQHLQSEEKIWSNDCCDTFVIQSVGCHCSPLLSSIHPISSCFCTKTHSIIYRHHPEITTNIIHSSSLVWGCVIYVNKFHTFFTWSWSFLVLWLYFKYVVEANFEI